jgi:hypothetical protein
MVLLSPASVPSMTRSPIKHAADLSARDTSLDSNTYFSDTITMLAIDSATMLATDSAAEASIPYCARSLGAILDYRRESGTAPTSRASHHSAAPQ